MIGKNIREDRFPVRFLGQAIKILAHCNYTAALTFDQQYFKLGLIFFVGLKASDSYHSPLSETIK